MDDKVLVPLDGSELAESVLPHVAAFARGCIAEVILLQVIAPPGDETRALFQSLRLEMPVSPQPDLVEGMTAVAHPIYREQEMASLRVNAQRCLNRAKNQLAESGLDVRAEVLFGRPAQKIVEYAEREGIDLIAMATHGYSGFRRRVFGSVAEKVLRTTSLPLLLITPPSAAGAASSPTGGQ